WSHPQQSTSPLVSRAHPCTAPTAMALDDPDGRETGVGRRLGVVEWLPSWPDELSPQQSTSPVASRAHVKPEPAPTCTAKPDSLTLMGDGLGFVVPFPSSPEELSPQHHTEPSARSAQVCPRS